MKIIFILSLIWVYSPIYSQNILVLPYDFGKLKPNSIAYQSFQKEIKKIDFTEVDSIHFVGNSDSIGTFLSNFRTTEFRARKLKKYLKTSGKGQIPYSILPTSGNWEKTKGSTRQINVVIFSTKHIKPNFSSIKNPSGCYKIAYSELQKYHRETISKGKKSYTQLDRTVSKANDNRQVLYYGTINKDSQFEAITVKWKSEKVGKSWWAKERETTTIPTDNFDRFKLFTIEPNPCTECNENLDSLHKIQNIELVKGIDIPLMENIQHKPPLFFRNKIAIKVPQEYVDLNSDYHSYENEMETIKWKEKDKDYYYAKVAQKEGQISPILRKLPEHSIDKCRHNTTDSRNLPQMICNATQNNSIVYNFAEFGTHVQNQTIIPYASIGMFASIRKVELEFLIGLHGKKALYGSIRGRYNFMYLPFSNLFTPFSWRRTLEKNRFWYSNLYVGAEYKASIGRYSNDYLEPNIHTGICISQNNGPTFHRIFLQYGFGVNFTLESPRPNYSILQLGLQLQLGKKVYNHEKGTI